VTLSTFTSSRELAQAAAKAWLDALAAASRAGGLHSVALSGGRIAKTLYEAVTQAALTRPPPLAGTHFFWADERCVPPEDAESNYRLAHELLLEPLNIPPAQIHRIRGEDGPSAAAAAETEMIRVLGRPAGGPPVLDLVLLGMGEDGHVASLFPGEVAEEGVESAVYRPVSHSPKPPPNRITLTYPAIAAARQVWVLASGENKAAALRESLLPGGGTPLARVISLHPDARVFTDLPGFDR
jgi:6-phosphogluconolactonase